MKMKALDDIKKQRESEARGVEDAYNKIEDLKERIQSLLDTIQRKEELIAGYDQIIEVAEKSLMREHQTTEKTFHE